MQLVALQDFPDAVGTIRQGQEIITDDAHGRRLVASGKCGERGSRVWSGLYWPGATVIILASGPSLSLEQCEIVRRLGHKTIAVNTSWRRAPWSDVLYACDGAWWDQYHKEVALDFAGECWTQEESAARKYGLHLVRSERGRGLCERPGVIIQGANSGYQAVGLAYQAAAARIILLGFDMAGGHWHGEHPGYLKRKPDFADWISRFDRLAEDLRRVGVEVVNATPGSKLRCFPMVNLADC